MVLSREPGGTLGRSQVLAKLASGYIWSQEDIEHPKTRPWETKWQNRASFERAEMVRQGLLTDAADGNWTLDQAGWEAVRLELQMALTGASDELVRRERMWEQLMSGEGPDDVAPATLREIGLYGGASGIFVNQELTKSVATPYGIAVSFLHTGKSYADEMSPDGVIYHYPKTKRLGHDKAEIAASKAAYQAGLPVFVIGPGRIATRRTVRRGYVEEYDDTLGVLLITFTLGQLPPPPPPREDDEPFSLTDDDAKKTYSLRQNRPNQQRFAMKVFQRYGTACAACGLDVLGLVQAAHLMSKKDRGIDDARNGLPLCANHHVAFDALLWSIEPETTKLRTRSEGPTSTDMRLLHNDLKHLRNLPHMLALEEAWKNWKRSNSL